MQSHVDAPERSIVYSPADRTTWVVRFGLVPLEMRDEIMKELPVPRYLFRIHQGDSSDEVEMDYSDPEHMRSEALRLAGESIQDMGFDSMNNSQWSLNVTDDSNRLVFSLTVTVTGAAT